MQVAGGGEHRAGVALGRGQGAFVEPARLDRTSARQPHVRQHDGRAQLVGDHAGRVQAGDRLGERVHRGAEVAGGPGRQADEAGGGTAREVVLRPGQRECPAGVRDRAVDVAPGLGDRGAVDRDHGREGSDLALPVPGRLGQRARRGDGRRAASCRDRPRRRRATPPPRRCRPRRAGSTPMRVASSGRRRTTSSGSATSQSRRVRSWRRRRRSATASSTRSAACSWSPLAIACRTASASSPFSASHRLAAACSPATRSASRAVSRARNASAKRWW